MSADPDVADAARTDARVTDGDLMTGLEMIAAERRRQVEEEGWTAKHDADHDDGQLLTAARCYATAASWAERFPDSLASVRAAEAHAEANGQLDRAAEYRRLAEEMAADPIGQWYGRTESGTVQPPSSGFWPTDWAWKPSSDPIRNLIKAGALIAAEIDRLRLAAPGGAR